MPTWLVAVPAAVVGLVVGSFANVPIHRWPLGKSVTEPARSACPSCGAEIQARDNVPVVSWVLLGGRCRHCDAAIHWRYPLVEAVTAVLFVAVALVEGATWLLPALLVVTWSLVVATVIDLEHRIIPNRLTYPLPFVVLALVVPPSLLGPGTTDDLVRGLIAAVVVPGGFLVVAETYRVLRGVSGFGMGDIKLLVSLGLVCGYLGWFEVVVLLYGAMITAVIVAIALLAARRAGLMSKIPFGPYLAAGTLLAVIAGDALEPVVLGFLGLR